MLVNKLVLALAAAASSVVAHPAGSHGSSSLQHVHRRSVGKDLPHFYPEPVYEHVDLEAAQAVSFGKVPESQSVDAGVQFLADKLDIAASDIAVESKYTDAAGVTHIYGSQLIDGIRVANHNVAVHVKNGKVLTYSSSFGAQGQISKRGLTVAKPSAVVSAKAAIAAARAAVGEDLVFNSAVPVKQEYRQVPGGKLAYAHAFELKNEQSNKWVSVSVDAATGELINVVDFVNDASYRVVALPKGNPLQGFSLVVNPEDATASPSGWTSDNLTTRGNNVVAQVYNVSPALYGKADANGVFETAWDAASSPNTAANRQTGAVQLFYIANVVHDITYQYGFTEAAGNFQNNNFGKGGVGNDAVKVNVLAGGTNNANFATPADGQPGVMNMYPFTSTNPQRDGGLDAVIPIHESFHGVSNRMTGGARDGACLQTTQSGSMGEGWSDFFGLIFTAKPTDTRTTKINVGTYAINDPKGIRSYPYSTDLTVNPLKYGDIRTRTEVHDGGEVWVALLWEVYWNLVDKYGFNANLYDAKSTAGNIVAMQLVIGGLAQQPCNPTFLQARDAILAADASIYGGKYKCDIWAGFAKRGAGSGAAGTTNSFALPAECSGTPPATTVPPVVVTTTVAPKTTTVPPVVVTTTRAVPTTTRAVPTTTRVVPSPTRSPTPSPTPTPGCNPNNICCRWFGFDC